MGRAVEGWTHNHRKAAAWHKCHVHTGLTTCLWGLQSPPPSLKDRKGTKDKSGKWAYLERVEWVIQPDFAQVLEKGKTFNATARHWATNTNTKPYTTVWDLFRCWLYLLQIQEGLQTCFSEECVHHSKILSCREFAQKAREEECHVAPSTKDMFHNKVRSLLNTVPKRTPRANQIVFQFPIPQMSLEIKNHPKCSLWRALTWDCTVGQIAQQ